jgi:ubiquinol-cytochrome c reductase cytochrome b subunit
MIRFLDEQTGLAPFVKKSLRYVFPDHWTFMLGEIALYCFVVLIATGVYLTFFFEPSFERVVYRGEYAPLQGQEMSQAYRSALDLSFDVRAGLLMRQTHHWAANVFLAAITVHLLRVLLTGAHRKPRVLTYLLGVAMLALAIPEGYFGYSMLDDLLSGMGLAIGYSVLASIPFVGGNLAVMVWNGEFPGASDFASRLYIFHVLVMPIAIGALLVLHLVTIALTHHAQFPGRTHGKKQKESNVVGSPLWPSYAVRSIALLLGVAGVLFLMGGLIQINPVWLYGPYEPSISTSSAHPDWYIGWLIGALRMMPSWEPHIGDYTVIPNPFWGGAFFPLLVFAVLFAWPSLERRITRDNAFHHLLDRPRDAPWRTATVLAFFTWVALIFFAGSADRVMVALQIPYTSQIWVYDVVSFVLPFVVFFVTKRICEELRANELVPLRPRPPREGRREPAAAREGE